MGVEYEATKEKGEGSVGGYKGGRGRLQGRRLQRRKEKAG